MALQKSACGQTPTSYKQEISHLLKLFTEISKKYHAHMMTQVTYYNRFSSLRGFLE